MTKQVTKQQTASTIATAASAATTVPAARRPRKSSLTPDQRKLRADAHSLARLAAGRISLAQGCMTTARITHGDKRARWQARAAEHRDEAAKLAREAASIAFRVQPELREPATDVASYSCYTCEVGADGRAYRLNAAGFRVALIHSYAPGDGHLSFVAQESTTRLACSPAPTREECELALQAGRTAEQAQAWELYEAGTGLWRARKLAAASEPTRQPEHADASLPLTGREWLILRDATGRVIFVAQPRNDSEYYWESACANGYASLHDMLDYADVTEQAAVESGAGPVTREGLLKPESREWQPGMQGREPEQLDQQLQSARPQSGLKFTLEIDLSAAATLGNLLTAITRSFHAHGAANFGTTAELTAKETAEIRDADGKVIGKWAVSE